MAGGEIRLAEQYCRDRAVLKDEHLSRLRRQAGLIEKDKDANGDEADGDHRRAFGGIVVLKRDHESA